MTSTFTQFTVNDLSETQIIAGTYFQMIFTALDTNGSALDLGGSTITWVLCPIGQPSYVVLTKTGVASGSPTNEFTITLLNADTKYLGGVYTHQPVVVDSIGKEFRQSQGILNIIPRIATS